MKHWQHLAFRPRAEPDKADHALVFTDVLFGFVIYELFTGSPASFQEWLHMLLATVLVLGSWIGFRRSRNRLRYQLKFFNLQLLRFLVDQVMVVLYFRIAILAKGSERPDMIELVRESLCMTALVFSFYVVWDLIGIWMCTVRDEKGEPKYPRRDGAGAKPDWPALFISLGHLLLLAVLCWLAWCEPPREAVVNRLFFAAIVTLLVYRWSKEIKTSYYAPASKP